MGGLLADPDAARESAMSGVTEALNIVGSVAALGIMLSSAMLMSRPAASAVLACYLAAGLSVLVSAGPGEGSHRLGISTLIGTLIGLVCAMFVARPKRATNIHSTSAGAASVEADCAGRPQLPAGWYPDPTVAVQLRYWDGTAWTGHVHPPFDDTVT